VADLAGFSGPVLWERIWEASWMPGSGACLLLSPWMVLSGGPFRVGRSEVLVVLLFGGAT